MPPESIEEVKLLSNLETSTRKLLQIILFGQPELDGLLEQPRLRQVRDRVVHRFLIQPLPPDDASRYLDHRLACAGSAGADLFTPAARQHLIMRAKGSVRRLNILADQSLLAAYAAGSRRVQRPHVETALRATAASAASPIVPLPALRGTWQRTLLGIAVGVGVGTLAGWWFVQRPETPGPSSATANTAPTTASPTPNAVATSTTQTDPAPAQPTHSNAAPGGEPSILARYAHLDAPIREIILGSRAALDDPKRGGYTLQVGIGSDLAAIHRLTALPRPPDWPLWIHDRQYPGLRTAIWAIYLGWFETRQAALDALRALPPEWSRHAPQIRSLAAIRAEGYPEQPPR